MALTYEVIYSIEDDSGDVSTTSIKLLPGNTLVQYNAFAVGMATLIDALVDGKTFGADLAVSVDLSGLSTNLLVGAADVEEVGAFQFTTTENRIVNLNVPGIVENLTLAGSDDLDVTHASVGGIITAMETGIAVTGGTIAPCGKGEDSITIVKSARERFRSSGSRK
jgi:hypothetical protein